MSLQEEPETELPDPQHPYGEEALMADPAPEEAERPVVSMSLQKGPESGLPCPQRPDGEEVLLIDSAPIEAEHPSDSVGRQEGLESELPEEGQTGTALSASGKEDWSETDQGYLDAVPEVDEEGWDLEEEFAEYRTLAILPPREKIKAPPSCVRPPLEPGSREEQKARRILGKVLQWMKARQDRQQPPRESQLQDAEFVDYIKAELSNPEDEFQPGNIHAYRSLWRDFLESTMGRTAVKRHNKVQDLLKMLECGVQPDWAPLDRPDSQKHPDQEKRMASVRAMLEKVYSQEEADRLLTGPEPSQVRLPNLRSVHEHTQWYDGTVVSNEDFVTQEVRTLVESGRLAEWHWPEGAPPRCILPMGVATRELEKKLRLIFDGRYINLWCKYLKFKYESLNDLRNYACKGWWGTVSDYKAGYHHLSCPELSTYLGVCWQGTVYVWTCLPFGYAPACRIFTEVTNIMYRPVREVGVNLTSYIDDRASASPTRRAAKWDALIQYGVMAACGWFVNLAKSELAPVQLFKFLGMLVDLAKAQFRVPEKRLALITLQLDRVLEGAAKLTPKEVASVAGRVGSTRLAIPVAPLLCWELHKGVAARGDGGRVLKDVASVKAALRFMRDHLDEWNGACFWKKQGGLVFSGDAGEMGSGGVSLTGDLEKPIQVSYTADQLRRLATHEFHSTIREVLNVLSTIQCLVQQITQTVSGRRLMYLTDSQAAFYAIMAMKSAQRETISLVYEIWLLCRQHDIDFTVRWNSRWEPHMQRADAQTRMIDNTAWGLKQQAFEFVLEGLGLQPADIQLDVFSQDDMKKAPRWYSLYNAPGSAGVDGFMQRWTNKDGSKAFCWINGPFHLMGRILAKVKEEEANGVLICPKWPKGWRAQLKGLPIVKTVTIGQLPGKDGKTKVSPFWPGARVSPEARKGVIHWSTEAHLIRW